MVLAVSTVQPTAIAKDSALGNGNITAVGASNPTRRGFAVYPGLGVDPIVDNVITNWSFETGTPPTGWVCAGTGATCSRSNEQVKYGTYSAKLANGAGNAAYYRFELASPENYQSKDLVIGFWVKASVADRVRLFVYDSDGSNIEYGFSGFHSGSGEWEWLEATKTIQNDSTTIRATVQITAGTAIEAYIDEAICIEGTELGNLIYSQIQDVYEDGSFSTGAYSLSIPSLDPVSGYSVRSYAIDTEGVTYGDTLVFTTLGESPLTEAIDLCLEMELDAETIRVSRYGLSGDTYFWEQRIVSASNIRRSIPLAGGLGTAGNCTFKLADADRSFRSRSIDSFINRPATAYLADRATGQLYQVLTGKMQLASFDENTFSIRLIDESYSRLQEFVTDKIIQDRTDWANLPATLAAVAIPILQGVVSSANYRKTGIMPAYLVDPALGQSKYRYIAGLGHFVPSNVYRSGVLMDAGDWAYTQTTDPTATYQVTYLDIDFDTRDGSDLTRETISWEGTGPNGTATPAEAIEEVLKLAGWTSDDYDTAAFAAANTLYDDAAKTILIGLSVVDKELIWEELLENFGSEHSARFFYNLNGKLSIDFESWEVPAADAYDYVLDDSIILAINTETVDEAFTGLKTDYALNVKDNRLTWNRTYSDADELTRQNSIPNIGGFKLPYCYDASSADSLIYCKLKSQSSERKIIKITTPAIAGLELGSYLKVISNFGSGASGYQSLMVKVLGVELVQDSGGGFNYQLTCVDHEGSAFPSISSADSAGADADVVEDSRDIATNIVFSSSSYNGISWSSGSIKLPSGQLFSISSGSSTGWGNNDYRYIYFDPDYSKTALRVSTDYSAPAVRRGYLMCVAKRSADSSSQSAPFNVRNGISDQSGATITSGIFQTSTANPKTRIDPTDHFQVINSGGVKIITMDPTNYFRLRDASGNVILSMDPTNYFRLKNTSGTVLLDITPTEGFRCFDTSGNRSIQIGDPDGTYVLKVTSTDGYETFQIAQETNDVALIWRRGTTYVGKMYSSSLYDLTIELAYGTGTVVVTSTDLECPIFTADALRPKTNVAADVIKIYEYDSTNQVSTIYVNNGSDDSGFAAGDGDATVRGIFWARAQTSGTARAGCLILENESGDNVYIWADHASPRNLRFSATDPGSNDASGTVIATLP